MAQKETKNDSIRINIGPDQLIIEHRYEVLGIINEILIAMWFIIGSFFFFSDTLVFAGTCLFVTGSTQMLIKPLIKIAKLIHIKKRFN